MKNGKWIPLAVRPSDNAQNGIPKIGDIVEVSYDRFPDQGLARIFSTRNEGKKVFVAKKEGITTFCSANP